ncbi:hypothetical protein EXE10_12585 [Acinetobacter sp. WCHAc060033]|jgi:hypothetical protein|uniref:hypothetical protein n=1 Tax=Acinetobacter sp. WCHAc060033 TaxID=2518624 RepID=UPI001023BDFE|nr:hypothetical protein [Acinetobacter sp. WCHAc060033]RZG81795.1 hypothetical protein EXE10_12585 [Acinetobacter sp. WCHAc060033]
MTELMSWLTVLAYFAVFLMGLVACFKDAKLSWVTRNNTGLTVFEKRTYKLKASASLALAFLAILGLFQAMAGV